MINHFDSDFNDHFYVCLRFYFQVVAAHRGLQCICEGEVFRKLGGGFHYHYSAFFRSDKYHTNVTQMSGMGFNFHYYYYLVFFRSHKCQGYLDEDGGRRPGHLVLYPIEVGLQPFPQQFLENHTCRFLLMEKFPQCRTSSRTQQLLSKELRAHIFRGSSPHKTA